ncbi:MAG TPA: TetR family transcriptional regulator [Solirubrobacteraceae bacterium]|nr:TetR family transcriptional regulator [Solirubrobacteraceae bacterium]
MATTDFKRARSDQAKRIREQKILDAAVALGSQSGIRGVTLTDIANRVGMHKSAMLRYFETREQIFLTLTADGWREWSRTLCPRLAELPSGAPAATVAALLADSLVSRPIFCDLLAQAPLNLERNVSLESIRAFKLTTLEEVAGIAGELRRLRPAMSETQAVDIIATATALAGAFWQMATPGPEVTELYRQDPRLSHAIVDFEPRLVRILTPLVGPSP